MTDRMDAVSTLSAVKMALAARRGRLSESARVGLSEPIAVIGLGCRFPGGAHGPGAYWAALREGRDAVREVPSDRWDADALHDPDRAAPGRITTRSGAFLESVDGFDAAFFGIAPREAVSMDPQQRLLLEVASEALDDGGQSAARLAGSRTGVFVACYNNDYGRMLFSDAAGIDAYTLSGTSHSIASGRLSFFYDLRGPSVTVDTACSASLVAIHLACLSLRTGECDLAVSGGVSLILSPESAISMSKWGMLAPDGRSKTYDARADGFGRGEGCGVVVLKRLSDALADGDPVRAVIRGTAINQDGRSAGLTAPNGLAQQAVVREALDNARVAPGLISLIEAHGTGTSLGDPIEVEALTEVLGKVGEKPCALGSVKTNIGHLEAAAGVAGLIKVVLALEREEIPPHLHFEQPNPHMALESTRFVIPTQATPWPREKEPRFAGVSSFGFGGTNAHVVLEEAPHLPVRPTESRGAEILVVSGHSEPALRAAVRQHAPLLASSEPSLRDICYTAAMRRTHHVHRAAFVADSAAAMRARLEAFEQESERRPSGEDLRIAFVYSGQGAQWWAMGRGLLERESVFRAAFEECDAALARHTGFSVLEELQADESHSRLRQTAFAQPAIFAVQMALTAVWRSWGVIPRAVVGHSLGEVAAACVARALDLDQAARVVAHRARLMQQITGKGGMAAVQMSPSQLGPWIEPLRDRLSIAASNAPSSCVLSGETTALEERLERLQAEGIAVQRLPVDYAFHSPQVEPFGPELARCLEGLSPARASLRLLSTVAGSPVEGSELGPEYWTRNMRDRVRFAEAVDWLLEDGYTTFVEIAPHPVLGASVLDCARSRGFHADVVPSLRRHTDERATMLAGLGALFTLGAPIDWAGVFDPPGRCVPLPAYPWQRQRFWISERARTSSTSAGVATGHSLLGRRLRSPLGEIQFESFVDNSSLAYLPDHRLYDVPVLPATAVIDAFLAAASLAAGSGSRVLRDVAFDQPLLCDGEGRVTQVVVQSKNATVELLSRAADTDAWIRHASARIGEERDTARSAAGLDLDALRARLPEQLSKEAVYRTLGGRGLHFGPSFRRVERLWRANAEILANIRVEATAATDLRVPPALDACLQGLNAEAEEVPAGSWLPVGVASVWLEPSRLSGDLWSHAIFRRKDDDTAIVDLDVWCTDGRKVSEWRGLQLRRVSAALFRSAVARADSLLYELAWPEKRLPLSELGGGACVILEDQGGTGAAVAALLESRGYGCIRVLRGGGFKAAGDHFEVCISSPDDFMRVLAATTRPVCGVLHMWALDEHVSEDDDSAEFMEGLRRTTGGALEVVKAALLAFAGGSLPPILMATRGAESLGGEATAADPVHAALRGIAITAATEFPDLRCGTIDLDPAPDIEEAAAIVAELAGGGNEPRVARRNGRRHVARLVRSSGAQRRREPPVESRLQIQRRGMLDTLAWEKSSRRVPNAGEVEIRVEATGLNFRDVLNAMGLYPGDPGPLGDECSGVVVAAAPGVDLALGTEVMAFVPGAFATHVTARAELAVRRPKNVDLRKAAGIPIAFLTAHYCLVELARLGAGASVLIHAGAGGVGLAAVQVARRQGARVFATAGSPEKRAFLESHGVERAFDSRTLSFADALLEATEGAGVDIVLNSLSGDFIAAGLRIVRRGGSFLEIGKTGIWTQPQVAALGRDIRYHVVDLGEMRERHPERIRAMLLDLATDIENGRLEIPPIQVFARGGTGDAFRRMSQARHIGKMVIAQGTDEGSDSPTIQADRTYLLTGGHGGVGRQLAAALVAAGARHLVILGRSAPTPDAVTSLAALERKGARVVSMKADVADEAQLARALAAVRGGSPPLGGVIHAAGILDDGVLREQTIDRFLRVLAPKAIGAWNLHRLTRGEDLDFFLCLSSIAPLLGWAGQSNYAAANASLDALAHRRRALGLPASSLAFGAWDGAGMTASLDAATRQRFERAGLAALDPVVAADLALKLAGSRQCYRAVLSMDWVSYARVAVRPIAEGLFQERRASNTKPEDAEGRRFPDVLAQAPVSRRRSLVLERLGRIAGAILGVGTGELDPGRPLRDIGMDSLMAVEMRNALSALLDRPLSATLLFEHPTLDALASFVLETLFTTNVLKPSATAPSEILAAMSDEEAEALLVKELSEIRGGSGV